MPEKIEHPDTHACTICGCEFPSWLAARRCEKGEVNKFNYKLGDQFVSDFDLSKLFMGVLYRGEAVSDSIDEIPIYTVVAAVLKRNNSPRKGTSETHRPTYLLEDTDGKALEMSSHRQIGFIGLAEENIKSRLVGSMRTRTYKEQAEELAGQLLEKAERLKAESTIQTNDPFN